MNSKIKVLISGRNPNIFVKKLISNNIYFSNYKKIDNSKITLIINLEDYCKLNKKNTIYDIKIINYYGLKKYLVLIKENFSFFISFILSLIFLIYISNLCFDINIVHNNRKLRNLINDELTNNNIKILRLIPSFNKRNKIINKIIRDNKNKIEWLEIERKGSKLIVKVTERKINKKTKPTEKRNIVAKKSGIIKKIIADNGIILKEKEDYVTKGDVIISGDIINNDEIKGQISAKGKVFAETWYIVKISYPLYYKEKKYLEEVKNNLTISFFDKNYYLRKYFEKTYIENNKKLIKENIFPFSISKEKQRKVKIKIQKLNKEKALEKAIKLAEKKLNGKLSNEEYIISKKNLKFNYDSSKIVVDVFFKVYENITDYKNTEDVNLN